MLEGEALEAIRAGISRLRRYASMREGGTKEQKEFGVVKDLLESMQGRDEALYVNPQLVEDDPPDCIAETRDGELVALEVTEFVSQAAIEHNQRLDSETIDRCKAENFAYASWSKPDVLEHIQHLLLEKDTKELRGGSYARYAVVIHTDEPLLVRREVEEWLTGHTFGPFQQLDEAYFLHPYERKKGYPYSRLELETVKA